MFFNVTPNGFYNVLYNTQVKAVMEIITNRTVVTVGYVSIPTKKHPKKMKAVITIPKHLINLFQSIIILNF